MRFLFSNSRPAAPSGAVAASSEPDAALSSTTKQRRVWPIHPVLFAAFPILALYVHNWGQVPFRQMLGPLRLALLGTFAVWTFSLLLTRQARKAAIVTSAVVTTFFAYTHILDMLPPALRILVAPGCVIALAALLAALLKTRRPLLDTTAILNFMAAVLIAIPLWTIGVGLWHTPPAASLDKREGTVTQSDADLTPKGISPPRRLIASSANLPDVYYIILDAYGRADRLQQFYGFDNTPFLQALQQRGFTIAPHSHANYDQTPLCLASALSMHYLDNGQNALTPESLRITVDDNAVAAYLRKFGYHYVCIWSGLEVSRVTTADLVLNNQPDLTHFDNEMLTLTPVGASSKVQLQRYDRHRERLLGVFNNLDTVAQLPYPKFVFAHVLAPHPPFVFGPNGEAINPKGILNFADGSDLLDQISREQYIRGYSGQLQFVNKRVLQAVDAILRQSRRPPVIIIQGDHGSRMNLDWTSQAKTDLREPFSILNAYYVPDKMRGALYDTITPVNSFRILLKTLFGAKTSRLPDRSFYSTEEHPYDFSEVTGLIHE